MAETADNPSIFRSRQFQRRALIAIPILAILLWAVWFLYRGNLLMPAPAQYEEGAGGKYSAALADAAQRLSLVLLIAGWICVTVGAFLAMTAALVGPCKRTEQQEDDTIIGILCRQRGLLCSAFAIIFAGIGWQLLDRSSAASQTASIATLATAVADGLPENDRKAYDACVRAKTSWLEGRMNQDRLLKIISDLGPISPTTPPEQ